MRASLRALLDQVLDYAGLFPPAQLPLEVALRNYLRERKSASQRWILGRFVCPVAKLPELLKLARPHPDAGLLRVTALGQPGANPDGILGSLRSDLQAIRSFRSTWGDAGVIDMYEFALPKGAPVAEAARQVPEISAALEAADLRCFLEIPRDSTWTDDVETLTQILREHQSSRETPRLGLKLRTGGTTADAFPSDAQVACFLDRVSTARLPWKATAGLHHPCRFWDNDLQVWHHGFLNLFTAGVLAATNPMPASDLIEIIAERHIRHFHFDDEDLTWRIWSCNLAEIAAQRKSQVTTFGCCSFEEPCQALHELGLL